MDNGNFTRQELDKARQIVINAIGETMDLYGVTPSTGRLFATMYFNEDPMTLDEMAEAMEMSKTSMSARARNLTDIKMMERVWEKGNRKDLYQASPDFFKNFTSFFCNTLRREIDMSIQAIEVVEPIYKRLLESEEQEVIEQSQKDLDKLIEVKKYFRWLDKLKNVFENGEIFDFVPRD
ncbi:MAG: GbsR/MarR family transcriptional regulator [Clostridiales bacterium]|nr:GbsR/MarR family transcriptional regulator [Clostridiales bacterium]MCF8022020.1 GbsR/MarR family transcriptional regulator [Clostridiales bacterium]